MERAGKGRDKGEAISPTLDHFQLVDIRLCVAVQTMAL